MSSDWNFYQLLVDSEPASIYLDLGMAEFAPIADYPTMAYLRVEMRNPRSDGLSSQDEFEDLVALEDQLTELIDSDSTTVYVGRNTSSGNRDFYFYTSNDLIEQALQRLMARWPGYDYQTGTRPDPEWSSYWNFLYPSPESMELIRNRELVDQLISQGDQIDVARAIDHFAIFAYESDRDEFVKFATDKGFSIASVENDKDKQFCVEFSKVGQPSEIDDVVIEIFRAVSSFNGEYDGWGCPTVS